MVKNNNNKKTTTTTKKSISLPCAQRVLLKRLNSCRKKVLFSPENTTSVIDFSQRILTVLLYLFFPEWPQWLSWMRRLSGDQEVAGNPRRGWQHSVMEIDHEIFSKVILSLLLIQEGRLSVSGERMCTILVNCLED